MGETPKNCAQGHRGARFRLVTTSGRALLLTVRCTSKKTRPHGLGMFRRAAAVVRLAK
jgi:hypothetical protein